MQMFFKNLTLTIYIPLDVKFSGESRSRSGIRIWIADQARPKKVAVTENLTSTKYDDLHITRCEILKGFHICSQKFEIPTVSHDIAIFVF
jgi:hypothetical protein